MEKAEKIGLSEALARIGDENTVFQRLDTDTLRVDWGKREAKITFATEHEKANGLADGTLCGLVVWVDAETMRKVVFG